MDKGFRLLALPVEIRLQVLRYTDLVAPLKEVYWNERFGFSIFYATACRTIRGFQQGEHFHHACQFRQCSLGYRCGRRLICNWADKPEAVKDKDKSQPDHLKPLRTSDPPPDGWKCRCWSPPQSLFLVCHDMRNEAEMIFFTENRIVLTSSNGFCTPPVTNPARFPASIFLERLRPSAARFLRVLEIVFPPFQQDFCPPESEVLADWIQVVQTARDKLCLSHLALCVYMADHLEFDYEQDRLPAFRKDMTPDDGAEVIETYKRILAPLAHLQGLKRFFLHLSWPWEWVARDEMDWEEGKAYCQRRSQLLEQEIGRSILGEEGYERYAAVEGHYTASQWLAWTELDFYL